jgi:hypothetical protein
VTVTQMCGRNLGRARHLRARPSAQTISQRGRIEVHQAKKKILKSTPYSDFFSVCTKALGHKGTRAQRERERALIGTFHNGDRP